MEAGRSRRGDGDLSLGAAIFQVAYGLRYFGQRVRLAHYGGETAVLDLVAQFFEVSLPVLGDVHGQPLAHHRRDRERPELPPDPGPPAAFTTGNDQRPSRSERPPQPGQAAV